MFKKIVLFALVLIPVAAFAQESQKTAYFNSAEVIMGMPQFKTMQDSLQKVSTALESEMKILEDEFTKKYTTYLQQQDSLVESIKIRRQQEIEDLRERAMTFQEQSQQKLQELQQTLLLPIQQKVQEALKTVGDENNFSYILEAGTGTLLYVNPTSPDATPLVKRKLGLQ